jgi:hypothetical protein
MKVLSFFVLKIFRYKTVRGYFQVIIISSEEHWVDLNTRAEFEERLPHLNVILFQQLCDHNIKIW